MKINSQLVKYILICVLTATLSSCKKDQANDLPEKTVNDSISSENSDANLKPTGPAPTWAPDIKPEMAVEH